MVILPEGSIVHMRSIRAIALFLAAIVLAGHGRQDAPSRGQWPPPLQNVANESPPLSPAEALRTFYLPPGYSVELVASEPLVQDPVAIDWDPYGRLWMVEMSGYMRNISGANER